MIDLFEDIYKYILWHKGVNKGASLDDRLMDKANFKGVFEVR